MLKNIMFFSRPFEVLENPEPSNGKDYIFVPGEKVCIAPSNIPLMTGAVATCSVLAIADDKTSKQLLAHVNPMNCSDELRCIIEQAFDISSPTLKTLLIPGAGGNGMQPTMSVPVIERALEGIPYKHVDNWYGNAMEYIILRNGTLEINEKRKTENPRECLASEHLPMPRFSLK